MVRGRNSLFKDYEELLIKNDKISEENRNLKYNECLLKSQIETLKNKNIALEKKNQKYDELIKEKEYEIERLKALLNIDSTNHGISTVNANIKM